MQVFYLGTKTPPPKKTKRSLPPIQGKGWNFKKLRERRYSVPTPILSDEVLGMIIKWEKSAIKSKRISLHSNYFRNDSVSFLCPVRIPVNPKIFEQNQIPREKSTLRKITSRRNSVPHYFRAKMFRKRRMFLQTNQDISEDKKKRILQSDFFCTKIPKYKKKNDLQIDFLVSKLNEIFEKYDDPNNVPNEDGEFGSIIQHTIKKDGKKKLTESFQKLMFLSTKKPHKKEKSYYRKTKTKKQVAQQIRKIKMDDLCRDNCSKEKIINGLKLGVLYENMNNYKNAIKEYLRILRMVEQKKLIYKHVMVPLYNILGNTYFHYMISLGGRDSSKFEELGELAMEFHRKCYTLASDRFNRIVSLYNMSLLAFASGKDKKSLFLLIKTIEDLDGTEERKKGLDYYHMKIRIFSNLCLVMLSLGNFGCSRMLIQVMIDWKNSEDLKKITNNSITRNILSFIENKERN